MRVARRLVLVWYESDDRSLGSTHQALQDGRWDIRVVVERSRHPVRREFYTLRHTSHHLAAAIHLRVHQKRILVSLSPHP